MCVTPVRCRPWRQIGGVTPKRVPGAKLEGIRRSVVPGDVKLEPCAELTRRCPPSSHHLLALAL